ncbi:MAG: hypothetical protein IV090_24220 [Candidatus Sericytochromatia bacterium]|nr:hypothetical protein [Candidatus Sericytochromatia bacterium]
MGKNMGKEKTYLLLVLSVLAFTGSYFLSEVFPFPLWWYYPLDQHWEFGIVTSKGLRMGWYGKVLLSAFCSLAVALLGGLGLKWMPGEPPETLADFLTLAGMGMTLFLLYYIVRILSGGA